MCLKTFVDVVLGRHVVIERLQFGERELLHRTFYNTEQFVTTQFVVLAKGMKVGIVHNSHIICHYHQQK